MTDRRPLTRVARGLGVAMALTAGALWTARPQAQPRPPIAIVGARIVDGSGNEPFTGTIVVSGGRITAVGRQVEPPADAQTIDGTGKAVLPGLIDTGVQTGLDRSSTAGRRWLGRVLASGITTAAVDGESPSSSGDPVQPRLVGMPAADAGASATPPGGGRALRSGTIGVALGDAASVAVKAVSAARGRLALSGVAGEDGTIEPARLAASGLTPLDAVTAMTGGGAWGLGLQSDRGLLAPGMRADLVVVAGDPSVSLDALAHVEHVFLGGVEVDRAALLRVAPEPAPPPPATTDAAAATPMPSSKASAPAPGRGRTRGAKGSKSGPPPAAAATETPPAAAAVPAPDAPPDAAPAAPAATSAAAAVAGARLADALLDDFERGDTVSAVGPAWVGSASDGGGSATTLIMGRVIKGLRDHALMISARMGSGHDRYARAALKLDAEGRPVDVSRFRGLRFDARGEGRYRVIFVTRAVADGRYHESYFSGSPLWTPVNIPFASIGQNGAGPHVPWTGRDVIEVRFEMVRDAGRLGWLELDNVTFY
ncbi:MAG TPA: amidohydrolase family protein [Vicinamibacterales bacterium]|nr:amidohydrolase family protein [Vicinamibacterales bacterium]